MLSFKPYYNWNTFNTSSVSLLTYVQPPVLNLIITGIPSIQKNIFKHKGFYPCFKPYYNWNTFNTHGVPNAPRGATEVLNLIITGIPSILYLAVKEDKEILVVLNLIITGIPSIQNIISISKRWK